MLKGHSGGTSCHLTNSVSVQNSHVQSVEQSSIARHCCPPRSPSSAVVLNHISSHFLTLLSFVQCPRSDSSFWTLHRVPIKPRLSRKFDIQRYVDIPPYLTYVATLPCETWMTEKPTKFTVFQKTKLMHFCHSLWVKEFLKLVIIMTHRRLWSVATTLHDVHIPLHSSTPVSSWLLFHHQSAVCCLWAWFFGNSV